MLDWELLATVFLIVISGSMAPPPPAPVVVIEPVPIPAPAVVEAVFKPESADCERA